MVIKTRTDIEETRLNFEISPTRTDVTYCSNSKVASSIPNRSQANFQRAWCRHIQSVITNTVYFHLNTKHHNCYIHHFYCRVFITWALGDHSLRLSTYKLLCCVVLCCVVLCCVVLCCVVLCCVVLCCVVRIFLVFRVLYANQVFFWLKS
jgi:hypothetical protein